MYMKQLVGLLVVIVVFTACTRNEVTGKKSFSLVSEGQMQEMAIAEYDSFIKTNKVLNNKDAEMVKRVGAKIATAITKYYTNKGKPEVLAGYKWEYNLVDDKQANAWCMPGGKIVVYTGLLALTQNEDALAVVMGHEVAHAVAQHGTQRMSNAMVTQFGGQVLSVLLANKSQETHDAFLTAYGAGTQLGAILPHSRKQELEADKYGLLFAYLANYDPSAAISFWERMAAASTGQKPPEIMSTHPADETRISKIKAYLPELLKLPKL
jgi:predicted Zn-dependent protease